MKRDRRKRGLIEDNEKFPHNTHLLGDAAYTVHNRVMVMVPFKDDEQGDKTITIIWENGE